MAKKPVFTPDWPFYAVAAHVVLWIVSTLFILSWPVAYVGYVGGQTVITLFWLTIVSALVVGISAAFSGRLYVGNQVLWRTPMVGWSARLAGMIFAGLTIFIMFFAYGISQIGR